MLANIVDFYYFSGTGNTLRVVKEMAGVFEAAGIKVNFYKIEDADPGKINLLNTIGVAFPVAVQSTYPLVWDFLKALPKTDNSEVFMVDTLAAFSGAIVGPLKKMLESKGYKTIAAKEIRMPCNLYPGQVDSGKKEQRISQGLQKANQYAKDIIANKSKWRRVAVLSDIFYFLVSRKIVWKMMGRWGGKFVVDRKKCNKCGLCVGLCPVKNITIVDYPQYDSRCQQCLRCVMFCPQQAITMPGVKHKPYRAVEASDLL